MTRIPDRPARRPSDYVEAMSDTIRAGGYRVDACGSLLTVWSRDHEWRLLACCIVDGQGGHADLEPGAGDDLAGRLKTAGFEIRTNQGEMHE